jgi:pantetheine-phosphate adenylyltransferase
MQGKKAVYGGTFDCPTSGHLHIIRKACKIFDSVTVVIAQNPNKKTLFSIDERKKMVKDMVQEFNTNSFKVDVKILPNDEYLVSYALSIGANFLVRGIRDNIDFLYEQNICITNKKIQKEIETIYLIPDESYGIISSSWVKGLVGMKGWRNVIRDHVTPYTLMKLEEKFLRDIFIDVCKEMGMDQASYNEAWERIVNSYSKNAYHNFDHLIDGIDAFNSITETDFRKKAHTLCAWFMHDIDPSEDISTRTALIYLYGHPLKNSLTSNIVSGIDDETVLLIQSTKHKTCEYKTEDEEIFASIDLLCLSGHFCSYDEYVRKVYSEYRTKSGLKDAEFYPKWMTGRREFLQKMLARKVIYPCQWIGEHHFGRNLENEARYNMQKELDDLASNIYA